MLFFSQIILFIFFLFNVIFGVFLKWYFTIYLVLLKHIYITPNADDPINIMESLKCLDVNEPLTNLEYSGLLKT